MLFRTPELLAPAGNIEKLKTAVRYGADAVYLGGQNFSLRVASHNFSIPEMREGTEFAHRFGVKVYLVLNSFMFDNDLEDLKEFLLEAKGIAFDGFIVSDLGVIGLLNDLGFAPIHLSTQASCLNEEEAKFYKDLGVKRIVLSRELTIPQIKKFKGIDNLEFEVFVHGALCVNYSGWCSISNYYNDRDANRGGCSQACRFDYYQQESACTFSILSPKDLSLYNGIERLLECGIDSLKIEGRMKSNLYVATIVKAYRELLDWWARREGLPKTCYELEKVPNRGYTGGFIANSEENQHMQSLGKSTKVNQVTWEFLGQVVEILDKKVCIKVNNVFSQGETIEILSFKGKNISLDTSQMWDVMGNPISQCNPNRMVLFKRRGGEELFQVVRKRKKE